MVGEAPESVSGRPCPLQAHGTMKCNQPLHCIVVQMSRPSVWLRGLSCRFFILLLLLIIPPCPAFADRASPFSASRTALQAGQGQAGPTPSDDKLGPRPVPSPDFQDRQQIWGKFPNCSFPCNFLSTAAPRTYTTRKKSKEDCRASFFWGRVGNQLQGFLSLSPSPPRSLYVHASPESRTVERALLHAARKTSMTAWH